MKFLYISLIILLLVAVFSITNCIYINNVSNLICNLCDEAMNTSPDEATSITEKIVEAWESERDRVSFSVPYQQIDRMNDYISSLLSAIKSGDKVEYLRSLSLLRDAAMELSRLEKLSLANIF